MVSCRTSVALVLMALPVAACAPARAASSAGTVLPTTVNVPPLSPSDQRLLTTMTGPNVLDHLATMDSAEIAMAAVAQRRTADGDVRDFARMLSVDHTQSLLRSQAISRSENMAMEHTPGDTNALHLFALLDRLKAAPASGFDHSYLETQIALHEHFLAELDVLRGVVRDRLLRTQVNAAIPMAEQHLERAEAELHRGDGG